METSFSDSKGKAKYKHIIPPTNQQTNWTDQPMFGMLPKGYGKVEAKTMIKCISLAEWWYNINYHNSLETTPFQALYGYAPPQCDFDSTIYTLNAEVT